MSETVVTVQANINAPIDKVWDYWTSPSHITRWNSASEDWHTPSAANDLRVGGRFSSRMEARDGSMGFDFGGEYTEVEAFRKLVYKIDDGRQVEVLFSSHGDGGPTEVVESFETEDLNSVEMQRGGWQAILDNFKKYVETN